MRVVASLCTCLIVVSQFVLYSVSHGQLSGSAGVSIASYRNAEGTDTVSPDRTVSPELLLEYEHKFSPTVSLRPSINMQYDLYMRKAERSHFTLQPELEFKAYLSNLKAIREESERKTLTTASVYQHIGIALNALADSTMALRIGAERTAMKSDALDDLQSDITATLLAYVSLLEEMGLTQSFKEVLIDELLSIKERAGLLGVPKNDLTSFRTTVDSTILALRNTIAESDFMLAPSTSETDDVSEDVKQETTSPSIITLVTKTNSLEHFSSSNFYPKYFLEDASAKTYATLLEIPLTFDYRLNRKNYNSYNYNSLRIQPRLEIYPSHKASLGLDYHFERSNFPNEGLYSFNEHAFRIDGRIDLASMICVIPEFEIGRRSYPNPMKISARLGQRTFTYSAPHNYVRLAPALGVIFFPLEKFSFGASLRYTANPSDTVIYLGGIESQRVTSSSFYGLASDESYIYEATSFSAAINLILPAELELGADVISEHRAYPPPPKIPATRSLTRTDDALWITSSLSRSFTYERNVLGFVKSMYPRLSVTYTILESNISGFSYSDLSVAAAFSISF